MKRPLLLLASALTVACAHGGRPDIATLASNSDQVIWEAGQKELERHNYDSARQHFKRIVEAFPQSQYGPAARLALGDSYFREGGDANYTLAASEYRQFLTLYPSHPRSDYAQFQVGECFFKQRNGPDRDQTQTHRALDEFQRLLDLYPSSTYAEQARARVRECRQALARAEFLVGYFYQRTRQAYRAAIGRYQGILAEYPDYEQLDEVLYRLAECLAASGRPAEARPQLARLLESFPESGRAGEARKLMQELDRPQAPAAAPPSPSPAAPLSPSPAPSPQAQVSLENLQKNS